MNPITPGLRPIHYDARSAGKVTLVIQPGDKLEVSDDVASQLKAASPQFKDAPKAAPKKAAPKKAKK
jgi:hypothetical protein